MNRPAQRLLHSTALAVVMVLHSGCALLRTNKSHYAGTDAMLSNGDYPAVIARVESVKGKAYTRKDRVVYYLDMGMLHHWNGEYEISNEFLEKAERAIEENYTKSLSRAASSLILNDNVLDYAGEDYEDIYLNAFKALNYLALGENDEAFVEVRRINNKLVQLESKHAKVARKLNQAEEAQETFRPGRNPFQESAFGRYLSLLLYRNEGKWDDVRIDLEKIESGWRLQPGLYPFSIPDFSAEDESVGTATARLNIIAFHGLAPDKQASTFYIHTEENLIVLAGTTENYLGKQNLSGLNIIQWPGIAAGYHFKLQLPSMHKRPSRIGWIEVAVSSGPTEQVQRLESLQEVAVETFGIKKPMIFLKTITRSVVKGLASEKAKEKMTQDMGEGLAFIYRIMADLAVDQTENADLRISRFFPAEVSIREIHLDEGAYDIRINYYGTDGSLLHTDERNGVFLDAGRLNVVESAYLN